MGTAVFAESSDVADPIVTDDNATIVLYENAPEETVRLEDENGNPVRNRRDGLNYQIVSRTLVNQQTATKYNITCPGHHQVA